jgi:hypothetical protein
MSQYESLTYLTWPAIHYTLVVTEENNEAVDPDLHRHPYSIPPPSPLRHVSVWLAANYSNFEDPEGRWEDNIKKNLK